MSSAAQSPPAEENDRPIDVAPAAADDDVASVHSAAESDQLSEIDEDQFEDYDPETANIQDRPPLMIDADAAQTLRASKRKRNTGAHVAAGRPSRRARRDGSADSAVASRRARRARPAAATRPVAAATKKTVSQQQSEEHLSPEERRRRAISRALDAASAANKKSVTRRKKKDEIDLLEDQIDDELSALKVRMEEACQADNAAQQLGQPAIHKMKLLPEVTGVLNRSNAQDAVVDPETNFLQHVRFFLEPLENGSLPGYSIQRDLVSALTRLPVQKETLISSKIGGLMLFYTRSRQPEVSIRRMAQRLVEEWSRPILNKTDDYSKRQIQTRFLDAAATTDKHAAGGAGSAATQLSLPTRPISHQSARDAERERILAPINSISRARVAELPSSYTVAPLSVIGRSQGVDHRPIGAGGIEAFRRMTQNKKKRP